MDGVGGGRALSDRPLIYASRGGGRRRRREKCRCAVDAGECSVDIFFFFGGIAGVILVRLSGLLCFSQI